MAVNVAAAFSAVVISLQSKTVSGWEQWLCLECPAQGTATSLPQVPNFHQLQHYRGVISGWALDKCVTRVC